MEANANTTYINPLYNCTSCSFNYFPYYSKFFETKICQNIYSEIITEKEISLEPFKYVENATAKDGICEKRNFFTPNGENCFPCNNEIVGMAGCKGACTFSIKRNKNIRCEGGCEEEGYIESSEGICESCSSINDGCAKCHYEDEYPAIYLGIKRKRRFVCDACENNFNMINGKCLQCRDLIYKCDICEIDDEKKNTFKCKKCEEGYILYKGDCYFLEYYLFVQNDEYYFCDDFNNGGIKGCLYCEKNDIKVICHLCQNDNFILLKENNTCLNRKENEELKKFDSCEVLSLDDKNELFCSKCKIKYSLLKENNVQKCEYTPGLYDYFYADYKNNVEDYYDYLTHSSNYDYYDYYDYYYGGYHYGHDSNYKYYYYGYGTRDEDYYYYKYYNLYPCQEASNLGSEENPVFTCNKCYRYTDNDKLYFDLPYIRIINEINNINYCIKPGKELYNCTEAINKTESGFEKYDCIKCINDNILVYNGDLNIHYCQYIYKVNKCVVKFCKFCKDNDNYFCSVCLLSDYEVNRLTGSCVKKTTIVPAVTWKDIFRLQLNSNKVINGRTLYGPSLLLRGITNSQINTRHAFLIYLTFKIKTRTRNLEDEKKIPTICEALNNSYEITDDVNIIDYECIGNSTENENEDLYNYELNNIEEGNNEGILKESNLEEIVKKTNLQDLSNKYKPNFLLNDLMRIVTFEINEVKDQISSNLKFDFNIDGKINKELNPMSVNVKLKLSEIEEEADCNFNIEQNKTANLSCKINLEKYKNKTLFTFKTSEINIKDNDIYLSKINEILLINKQEKEGKEKKEEIKKKSYTVIIVVSVVCGVILISAISFLTYFIRKRKKSINNPNNNGKKEINNIIINDYKINQQDAPKTIDELKTKELIKKFAN